ncbi:NAD(+) diphosphatase [Alteromonas sp. a30]|uniref:NAD(+) diphosphatase n=1 Tax=Alteromonas sp. a30 TaxID=2730917 RepID=UPI00227EC77B|nr:NAD(+) diphosphatase [Alteromonas sp. a30]MCY7294737.1 NAD(+) diphosphatase [Alteromonas sp. a30]
MITQSPIINGDTVAYWIVISEDNILSFGNSNQILHCCWQDLACIHAYEDNIIGVGSHNNKPCYLVDTGAELVDYDGGEYIGLRMALMEAEANLFGILARAWQIALFMRTHRFCGQCGSRMHNVGWEMAVQCGNCSHRCYPRISPCIIVAIRDEDRILLAQGVHHKAGMYSTLAGFVESGESLEETVHREVFEEVGVRVKNLEYFSSQPWPFPHSLMVGFLAEYDGGELVLDEKEIVSAGWYTKDNLPLIPPKFSIAGQLIEATLNRIEQTQS